jgi:hypothetical protein
MPPYLLLLLLLGATYGVFFHLWRGKLLRDLVIYILTGAIGIILGHTVGDLLGFSSLMIGPLHLIEASLVGWFSLFLIHWLRLKPTTPENEPNTEG